MGEMKSYFYADVKVSVFIEILKHDVGKRGRITDRYHQVGGNRQDSIYK